MTVGSLAVPFQYEGNSVTTSFSFPYKFIETSDLKVLFTNTSGSISTLVEDTDYTISGAGDEGGGAITYPISGDLLAAGEYLTIVRQVPYTQEEDLSNQDAYFLENLEDGLDNLARQIQQVKEITDRCPKLSMGDLTTLPDIDDVVAAIETGVVSIDEYSNDLAAAVAAIGASPTTLVINTSINLSVDLTTPSTLTLWFVQGGLVNISTGKTLTMEIGPFAGIYKIFNYIGTGKVIFGGLIDTAYPQWWGAKADGVTDDTAAIKSMIAAVGTVGAVCIFPYGSTGVYLVESQIVEGTTLPEGLTFRGVRRLGGNSQGQGRIFIWYTGADICWDIQEPDGTGDAGGWSWENFSFKAANLAGGMFQFNDVTREMTSGVDSPKTILHVEFKACSFFGSGGAHTGNAIQALGLFELHVDEQCFFRDWKRGIYLKGCDNYTLAGRYYLNNRNIQTTVSGIFGNDGLITANFLGNPPTTAKLVEDAYLLWIGDKGCTVISPGLEVVQDSSSGGTKGMLYLSGWGTHVYSPRFGLDASQSSPNNVLLKLGATARECIIINPIDLGSASAVFDIEAPTSWEWRHHDGNQVDYQLTIINPNELFARQFRTAMLHPRIKVIGGSQYNYEQFLNIGGLISVRGASLKNFLMTPFTLGRGAPFGGMPYITDVVTDTDAGSYSQQAIELGTTGTPSVTLEFLVGYDIQEGDLLSMTVLYKFQSAVGSGQLNWAVQKNQGAVISGTVGTSTVYATVTKTYTVSGFSAGNRLQFGVYNTADENCNIACISVSVVQAVNADTSLTFSGGDTVNKSEVVDLQVEVNEIKAALRAMKIIAP